MELDTKTIGTRIRNKRKELSLTQLEIQEKTGISSGNMSDIERGNRLPAAATLIQLAQVLQCSIDYLLTGCSPNKENTPEEAELLHFFGILSKIDREELLAIARMKYERTKKEMGLTASFSDVNSGNDMA